jgi:hypothetical protein
MSFKTMFFATSNPLIRNRRRKATCSWLTAEVDPIGIILARVGTNPHTIESRALRKAMCAVIATEDHMAEADL